MFDKIAKKIKTLCSTKQNKKISHNISKHGFHVIGVKTNSYMFDYAYTIGLEKTYQHPELLITGLEVAMMFEIISSIVEEIRGGLKTEEDKSYSDFTENNEVFFVKIDEEYYQYYTKEITEFYEGENYRIHQILWPDKKGYFPGDDKFEKNLVFTQPILNKYEGFVFLEDKNLGVFTTRGVIDLNLPIKYVYHDENGDWQFMCGTMNDDTDAKIICLEHLVKKDPSLNHVFDMGYGEYARRDDESTGRKIEKNEL